MISFKDLKDIVILVETDTNDELIGELFSIPSKKIKKYYLKGKKIFSKDMDEEAAASGGGSAGTAAPAGPSNVNKWTGAAEGRANPRSSSRKWESGLTRGKANPLA